MKGRQLVDAIMRSDNGVLAIAGHRSLRSTVWRLVRAGVLARAFPGVYLLAAELTRADRWLAAACAWKPDAVLCGDVAGRLHSGIAGVSVSELGTVELSRPTPTRPRGRVRFRRRSIPPDSTVSPSGIRVASIATVAVDAAGRDDGRAIDTLLRSHQATVDDLSLSLSWFTGTRGNPERRRVVRESLLNPFSYAERQGHRLLRRAGITDWVANEPLRLGGRLIVPDVRLRDAKVIVEFDGYEFHGGRDHFESDRERQNWLASHGYLVVRVTWTMITQTPQQVVSAIRSARAEACRAMAA